MLRHLVVIGVALLLAPHAVGQPTPEARALIERLGEPPEGDGAAGTRGLRPPGQPPAASAPAVPLERARRAPGFLADRPFVSEYSTAPPGVRAVSLFVHFETGSAELSAVAKAELSHLGAALADSALARLQFLIEGHADTVGPASLNQMLSMLRAEAVKLHLVAAYGIAPERLLTTGRGETAPLIPTADEVPEWRNRRVQILRIGPARF